MIKIPVNHIYEQDGVINGICALNETVVDTLKIIYPTKDRAILNEVAKRPNESSYFLDKFCQFIVKFQYEPKAGYSLKFIDFNGDMDIALDEYLILQDKGWEKQDRDRIMELFSQIKSE